MSWLPTKTAVSRARFIAVVASLTLCLLVAATLASDELRAILLAPSQPVTAGAVPYLGLTYVPLSHELAARYGVEAGTGVLVTDVEGGSPASIAGLRTGDILLTVDTVPLTLMSSMVELLSGKHPGDRVTFQALRDGRTLTVELTLGASDGR